MNLFLSLSGIEDKDRAEVGGKGFALAKMARKGFRVPGALMARKKVSRTRSLKMGRGTGTIKNLRKNRA
jgi:phosphoenolpyruvate synthase/pyruvate phosphate dikinase